jgi:hypothetical protein
VNPKKGDIVTFAYETYSRSSVPVHPKVFRIRTDLNWEAVVKNFLHDIPKNAINDCMLPLFFRSYLFLFSFLFHFSLLPSLLFAILFLSRFPSPFLSLFDYLFPSLSPLFPLAFLAFALRLFLFLYLHLIICHLNYFCCM